MKYILLVLVIYFPSRSIKAQQVRNEISIELGGSSLLAGVHYERLIIQKAKVSAQVGLGIYGFNGNADPTFPIGLRKDFLIIKNWLSAEIGYSATYSKAEPTLYFAIKRNSNYIQSNFWSHVPSASLQYNIKKNWLFKCGLSPVVNHNGAIPWVHFTFGKKF